VTVHLTKIGVKFWVIA